MHATLQKFGYPATIVKEFDHWCVLMRPQQATFGALVIAAKSDATALPALPPEAFSELRTVTSIVESGLKTLTACEKINYLMLMMVDPHVHFHVLPRFGHPKSFEGVTFQDRGWPGPPDLKFATDLAQGPRTALLAALRQSLDIPC